VRASEVGVYDVDPTDNVQQVSYFFPFFIFQYINQINLKQGSILCKQIYDICDT